MRKNAPRKWLHAILDLLPVILIPVFMIFSHRHTIEGNQAQVQENIKVNFNQLVKNGNFSSGINDWNAQYCDYTFSDDTIIVSARSNSTPYLSQFLTNNIPSGHVCIIKAYTNNIQGPQTSIGIQVYNAWVDGQGYSSSYGYNEVLFTSSTQKTRFDIRPYGGPDSTTIFSISNVQLYDLTDIFGVGNEPTLEEFNTYFPNDYYDYTLSKDIWIEDYNTVIYSDTDIMSQFSYQLYNATDKYFNMDKAFNLGAVHQWFDNNIFNGQPPLYMNVVWHIIAYELLMDLMFLLYALFMWFVDWCKSLIERTYDTSRGK